MNGAAGARLVAAIRSLPVGVIVVDEADRVVEYNARAEEFIACVGRPTLFVGMTLEGAHSEPYRPGMSAMMERLREGREFPSKTVCGGGRTFRVSYNPLFDDAGSYLGVAQVIEFIEGEDG